MKPDTGHPWAPMTSPPSSTGRYVVAHHGAVGGDAYFVTDEDAERLRMRPGWNQLPQFGATHWIAAPNVPLGAQRDAAVRFWPPEKTPAPAPRKPQRERPEWLLRDRTARAAVERLFWVTGHDRIKTRDPRVTWLTGA